MSDQFFFLQLKLIPKIGHTFTDEREVVVEVPKDLVQRKSESINESLREVIVLDLAKSAALGAFPTDAERALDLYDEDPPIWYDFAGAKASNAASIRRASTRLRWSSAR